MSGRDEANRTRLRFEVAPPSTATSMTPALPSSESSPSDPSIQPNAALNVQKWCIRSDQAAEVGGVTPQSLTSTSLTSKSTGRADVKKFSWPLGDSSSGERLECYIPMSSMTEASQNGGNVRLQWQTTTESTKNSFRLFDGKSSPPSLDNANASPTTVVDEKDLSEDAPSCKRPRVDEATKSTKDLE